MSDIEESAPIIPNATTITNKKLNFFKNVKRFLDDLTKDVEIEVIRTGPSFEYHESIVKNRYYTSCGIFMDYFVRKHLSNRYRINITDSRTEHILNNADDYIIGSNQKLRDAIVKHYAIFKNPETKAMDIIYSIKVVSLSHIIFFQEDIPKVEFHVSTENLKEIIYYFDSLPYTDALLNPTLGCDYFTADADIIFDKSVVFEIKTSRFMSLERNKYEIEIEKFYQCIIYAFGYYKNTENAIKTRKFQIYNTLLGFEYTIQLKDDIDFVAFEEVLREDVARYSELAKSLKDSQNIDDFI